MSLGVSEYRIDPEETGSLLFDDENNNFLRNQIFLRILMLGGKILRPLPARGGACLPGGDKLSDLLAGGTTAADTVTGQ